MTDNLAIWKRFADIDPKFTKAISGKDYKGTSPNAHYVIQCLTELFGPVGQGFGWNVLAEDIAQFGDTSIHWCRIEFWHTDRANTFQAYGQTKMAYTTQGGYMKVDEDAPKKSLTDAITKAAAQIGVASNIFLGRWDDNRYVQEVEKEYREKEKETKQAPPPFDAAACDARLRVGMAKLKTKQQAQDWWRAEAEARVALKGHAPQVYDKFYADFAALTLPDDPALQAPPPKQDGPQDDPPIGHEVDGHHISGAFGHA